MFYGYSKQIKTFVIVLLTLVCTLFSITTTSIFIKSSGNDKQPALVLLLTAILFDVVWFVLYKFYVSKIR